MPESIRVEGISYRKEVLIGEPSARCIIETNDVTRVDDSAFRSIMFPDQNFPGKRRMGKTARSQFYRTGIVLCYCLSVRPCTSNHTEYMLSFQKIPQIRCKVNHNIRL